VVQTPFGYHIIQVERIEPAEIQARHILIQPHITPAQVEVGRKIADSLGRGLAAGAPFEQWVRIYSDPDEQPLKEGIPIGELPPDYAKAFGKDSMLGLLPPFELEANSGRPKFAIVEITKWEPEGDLKFEDVKDHSHLRANSSPSKRTSPPSAARPRRPPP
jgi:peptidyl-prolyl cis-trans isomerase SurA